MDFAKIIEAAHEANERDGIPVRGGKKYLSVALRMDLMRRHIGAWGVETEILSLGKVKGEPVVMKATIRDDTGRVIGTGHAFEVIGQGNVNSTSALENAETSAVGRALAAIGIHGGEYASANEMEGVDRKNGAQALAASDGLKDAWEAGIKDALPENASKREIAEAYAAAIITELGKMKTIKGLNGKWAARERFIEGLRTGHPDLYAGILDTYQMIENGIKEDVAA